MYRVIFIIIKLESHKDYYSKNRRFSFRISGLNVNKSAELFSCTKEILYENLVWSEHVESRFY